MATRENNGWKKALTAAVLVSIVVMVVAAATGLWVLTAIPIGFLFGFFMERSDLCGASAFSEVVLMKDMSKVWGIWVVIAASMLLFSLGAAVGLIKLNPKPMLWANYVVGGVIFGVGTVLAGGCVSGCLFKAGQGNLNSMAALVAMPIGMAAVAYGPLAGFNKTLSSYVIKSSNGGPLTLSSFTGLRYWSLAILISGATLALAIIWSRRSAGNVTKGIKQSSETPAAEKIFLRRWKPWHSGIAIGILALVAYVSSAASGRNYPLGVTHGVLFISTLATESPVTSVYKPVQKTGPRLAAAETPKQVTAEKALPPKVGKGSVHKGRKVVWWLVFLVLFLVVGSYVSARMRGSWNLSPKPPDETIVAFIGGLMVGMGAWLATACVIGHIFSGVALLSLGSILFAVTVVLSNWVTTYAYLMGGLSR